MLLVLQKDEYLPALKIYREDELFANFVSILGEILVQRHHAVYAPPLLLDEFSDWFGLSNAQRHAFREARRLVTLRGLPFEEITDGILISGPHGESDSPPGMTRWHRRSWKWLERKATLHATCLAAENISDALWYEWLGRAWSAYRQPKTLGAGSEINFRARGCGGQNMCQELPPEAARPNPLLCIADSDRDYPGGPLGPTASAAYKAAKNFPSDAIAKVEPTPARNVENLIPEFLVTAVAGSGTEWLEHNRRRKLFCGQITGDEYLYLHLSKNQCAKQLLELKDPKAVAYRRKAVAQIQQFDPEYSIHPICEPASPEPLKCSARKLASGEKEVKWDRHLQECTAIRSIGKSIPRSVVKLLEEENRTPKLSQAKTSAAHWLADCLNESQPLQTIGSLVWSWGLAMPVKIRSTG